jgi:hypothetical protein
MHVMPTKNIFMASTSRKNFGECFRIITKLFNDLKIKSISDLVISQKF